jgi:hypothetical protein
VNRIVLLDNEAIQALGNPAHRKHGRVLDEVRIAVSVADAHLGAAIRAAEADYVLVLTSDPGDMRKAAEGRRVHIVAL